MPYKKYVSGRDILQPWLEDTQIAELMSYLEKCGSMTLVDWDRMWIVRWGFLQTTNLTGEIWELGVYRGGSALFLKRLIETLDMGPERPALRLFDSFEGLSSPAAGVDLHEKGDFGDTSLDEVKRLVGEDAHIDYRIGWVPSTFKGLEKSRIRFAHIDLDLHDPIYASCEFVYPRLEAGGVIVFDDYGFDSCPGARKAIDDYFRDKREAVLYIPTGQAVVVKLPPERRGVLDRLRTTKA